MSAQIQAFIGTVPVRLSALISPADQARGFQHHTKPNPDEGLVFLYRKVGPKSFHMRNVPFDVDLICLDTDNQIISITKMQANSNGTYTTPNNCKNVIEVPSDWDGSDIVVIGDKVEFIN